MTEADVQQTVVAALRKLADDGYQGAELYVSEGVFRLLGEPVVYMGLETKIDDMLEDHQIFVARDSTGGN